MRGTDRRAEGGGVGHLRAANRTLEEVGRDLEDGLVLRRRPTQQELANMVGSSRETVSRALAAMARQGLAVPRGRTLVLTEQLLRRGTTCDAA